MIDPKRRLFVKQSVAATAAAGLSACATVWPSSTAPPDRDAPPTIDLHSHAGRVILSRSSAARPFVPLVEPMRAGGLDVVCLAIVADTPVTREEAGHIRAWREPRTGELSAWAIDAYARADALIASEGLTRITTTSGLRAATGRRSGVIVASEGADFLEGDIDRVDLFHRRHGLRHLQLTHYRVNELGDIQTAPPVHGGLTRFGRAVVQRCNRLGIVVDVAHAPIAMVRDVVAASDRPIVLSHTSLSVNPAPLARVVSPEHARLVASTGGVIGIWPPASRFPSMRALALGIAAMADVVGVDHVGLGTDMLGLTGAAIFSSYTQLPTLVDALRDIGFDAADVAKIVGANYARVFIATLRG